MGVFRSKSFRKALSKFGLAAGICLTTCLTAFANPSGPQVRHGQVNVISGTQTQIQQLTDRAIVDWNSFSIGATESVMFLQPSQLSVILNRVTGADPSTILGSLSANGNVFLINPNGILFGPNSQVNVGGLVASTMNLTDEDFLAGNYSFFSEPGQELAAVVNQGSITVTDGGYAVLTGSSVINEGTIVARSGNVTLAAGEQATLNLDGRDLVHFALDRSAGDGVVLLAPGMMSDSLSEAFGVRSELRADRFEEMPDGSVRMVSSAGTLVQAGRVSADAAANGDGGSVLLDSTALTLLADGSSATASGAGEDSAGGEVLVLSSLDGGFTDLQTGALVAARGGESGDGGFVEVSGYGVNVHGEVDLSAADGNAGSFLLDPETVTIVDGDDAPTTVGDQTTIGERWFATITASSFNLMSTGDVIFDLATDGSNPVTVGPGNDGSVDFGGLDLTITAGTDAVATGVINLGDDSTTLTNLDSLTLVTDGQVLFGDSRVEVGGNVTVDSDGLIDMMTSQLVVTGRGDIFLDSQTAVDLGSAQINQGTANDTSGFFRILSGGSVNLGTSLIRVDSVDEVNPLQIDAATSLDMGDSTIVVANNSSNGSKGLILTAGGDLDLGSSDLTFRDNLGLGSNLDRITAGGRIFSDAADGNPTTYVNNYSLTSDDGQFQITAGADIFLPDMSLTVMEIDGGSGLDVTLNAQGGNLNLSESRLTVQDDLTLTSSANILLETAELKNTSRGDLLVDAAGNITMTMGSINDGATNDTTGFVHLLGDGTVSLGNSRVTVNSVDEENPLRIEAGPLLDLGNTQFEISNNASNGAKGLILTATGDIDLGSSDLTFRDNLGLGTNLDRITAGGRIFSDAADGNAGTFVNNYTLTSDDGTFEITAGADIFLPDMNLIVMEIDGGELDVSFTALNGNINLSESRLTVQDDLTLTSSSDILLDTAELKNTSRGDLLVDAVGNVTMTMGSINAGAVNDSTGFVHLLGGGTVSLGNSTVTVNSVDEVNPLRVEAGPLLDLGSTQFNISNDASNGNKGLILTATGDIDLGSSDLTFRDNLGGGTNLDRITAGGRIFSDAADGNAGTFVNNYTLTSDDGTFEITAGADIFLPDINLMVSEIDGGALDVSLTAQSGNINLSESRLTVEDDLSLTSSADILLDTAELKNTSRGDLLVDAAGNITMTMGSINDGATNDTTGFVHLLGGGTVSLGNSTVTVNSADEVNPLRIEAGPLLDLGSTQFDISNNASNGDKGLILTATGDIDLGSSDLTFRDNLGAGTNLDRIAAGGRIFSDAADGNPATYVNNYTHVSDDGTFEITAVNGIDLPDFSLDVSEIDGGALDLLLETQTGLLNLGSSRIVTEDLLTIRSVQGDINHGTSTVTAGNNILTQAGGTLDASGGTLVTTGAVQVSSNGRVIANGSEFQAPDIEIFGFDAMTLVPGGAVPQDVRLDLANTTSTDLTVLADGAVEIHSTGGGTLVLEQPGAGTPTAIRSNNDDVSIFSDGDVRSGAGLDIFAGGTALIEAANIGTIAAQIDIDGQSVVLDGSSQAGSLVQANLVGGTQFLDVTSNLSRVNVQGSSSLNSNNSGGNADLTFNASVISDLVFTEVGGGVLLDGSPVGTGQRAAIRATAGDITMGTAAPLTVEGELFLDASGSVGSQAQAISLSGGTIAAEAGAEIYLASDSDALAVGTVNIVDHRGNAQVTGDGVQAAGDVKVEMTSSTQPLFEQKADIGSATGGVVVELASGNLQQSNSSKIAGKDVVLKVAGNAGQFDSGAVQSEVTVEADRLILDVGGDAIVKQTVGDLSLASSATVGGETYNATGAGGELRVQNLGGDLNLDADLVSIGDAALVNGSDLTLGQTTSVGDINLNGSLTVADGLNLVVLSDGNINYLSGKLTAPNIGLGAKGTIGSTAQPVSVDTLQLTVNPLGANVVSDEGFTASPATSAVGITVNQGVTPPPPPVPDPVPIPTVEPPVFDEPVAFEEPLSQNNTDLVEETLIWAIGFEPADLVELDPTRPPVLWPEDEFLQKKFRR